MNRRFAPHLVLASMIAAVSGCTTMPGNQDPVQVLANFVLDFARQLLAAALL